MSSLLLTVLFLGWGVLLLTAFTLSLWFIRLTALSLGDAWYHSRALLLTLTFLLLPLTAVAALALRLGEGGLADRVHDVPMPQEACATKSRRDFLFRRHAVFTAWYGESCVAYLWPGCTVHRMYCSW